MRVDTCKQYFFSTHKYVLPSLNFWNSRILCLSIDGVQGRKKKPQSSRDNKYCSINVETATKCEIKKPLFELLLLRNTGHQRVKLTAFENESSWLLSKKGHKRGSEKGSYKKSLLLASNGSHCKQSSSRGGRQGMLSQDTVHAARQDWQLGPLPNAACIVDNRVASSQCEQRELASSTCGATVIPFQVAGRPIVSLFECVGNVCKETRKQGISFSKVAALVCCTELCQQSTMQLVLLATAYSKF